MEEPWLGPSCHPVANELEVAGFVKLERWREIQSLLNERSCLDQLGWLFLREREWIDGQRMRVVRDPSRLPRAR